MEGHFHRREMDGYEAICRVQANCRAMLIRPGRVTLPPHGMLTGMRTVGSYCQQADIELISDNRRKLSTSREDVGDFNLMQNGSEPRPEELNDFRSLDPAEVQERYIAPLFSLPRKLPVTAWQGHIPFLFVLFRNLQPARYVDLGVHLGASLIAAATAAQIHDLKTEIWGVDTWEGDVHAGGYEGDKIYADLLAFSQKFFSGVHLLRSTFDQAKEEFSRRPIDLLHIDGLHTYEAVKHDYETWLPVMSDKGVILFHDTAERDRGFGVWRLWDELKPQFPSLEFTHSHGLGVLFVGPKSLNDPYLKQLVEDRSLFDLYRATVTQVADLLPVRAAFLNSELELGSNPPDSGEGDTRKLLAGAQEAVQHYKDQLKAVRKHHDRLMRRKSIKPLKYLKNLVGK